MPIVPATTGLAEVMAGAGAVEILPELPAA